MVREFGRLKKWIRESILSWVPVIPIPIQMLSSNARPPQTLLIFFRPLLFSFPFSLSLKIISLLACLLVISILLPGRRTRTERVVRRRCVQPRSIVEESFIPPPILDFTFIPNRIETRRPLLRRRLSG